MSHNNRPSASTTEKATTIYGECRQIRGSTGVTLAAKHDEQFTTLMINYM